MMKYININMYYLWMKCITYPHYSLVHLPFPEWGKCSWATSSLSSYQQLPNLQKYSLTTSIKITDHSHVCLVITLKLNISSLWSRTFFFKFLPSFLTTDFIYNSTDSKLIIHQPGSFLETPYLLLGWVSIWFNHSNCTALIVLRTSQENKGCCRGFHL